MTPSATTTTTTTTTTVTTTATTPPPDPTTTTPPPEPTTTTVTTTAPPPGPVPDAPVIYLTQTPAPRFNYIEWSVPADNGSEIVRFNIYRGLTAGGETFLRGRSLEFNFADDLDVTYYYVVTAENANGESVWSNEVAVTAL